MAYRFVEKAPQEEPSKKSKYRFVEEQAPEESLGSNIGRQIGRGTARVAETALGAPRAFGDFLEGLVPEKAIKAGAEKVGLGQGVENLLENTKRFSPYKLFPKSEDIRENITKNLFGKKLEPQNEWERKADDLVSDFTALALPFPGMKLKFLKPALLALGGTAVSEGIGQLGGSEKEKQYGKIGAIVLGSMINPKGAENLAKGLYADARAARPADAKIAANKLSNSVDAFEKQLIKGDPNTPSKSKSFSLIKNIKSKIKNGEIDVEELEQFKRDINEARSSLYDDFKSDKVGRKSAKRNLDTVSKYIDNTLTEYGKTNPEWEAAYRPANEVYGAIAQSKKTRNWMFRNAKIIGFPTLAAELGLYASGGIGAALGGAALGAGALGSGELIARIMKSPTLRKYYTNAVTGALKEDAVLVHENLKKLSQSIR